MSAVSAMMGDDMSVGTGVPDRPHRDIPQPRNRLRGNGTHNRRAGVYLPPPRGASHQRNRLRGNGTHRCRAEVYLPPHRDNLVKRRVCR